MAGTSEPCFNISFGDAVKSSKDPNSCLFVVPVNERLILQPYYLSEKGRVDEKAVAKDLLGPLLFAYNKKLEGIPVSYGKIKFSKDGRIQENTGYIIAFVSYVMVVFRPHPMANLIATVNKILPKGNCVGMLAHNFFNISCILRNNQKVEVGEEKQVQIISLVCHKKSLQIKAKISESNESCDVKIKQEVIDETEQLQEALNDSKPSEVTGNDPGTITKKRKRKSLDLSEPEVTSGKTPRKKKLKLKVEAEDS